MAAALAIFFTRGRNVNPPDEVTHHHGCDGAMGRRCDGDGDDGATVPHRLGEVIHSHGSDGAMARRCDGDDSAPVDKVIHHRGCDVCDGATVRRCDGAVRRRCGATVRATPLWR